MKEYLKRVYSDSKESFYNLLSNDLKNSKERFIITVNPETLMMSENNDNIKKMLLDEKSTLVPDGIAVVKSMKMLGIDVKERITGVDICDYLLSEANNQGKSIYLFGSKDYVIKALVDKIENEYKNIKVLGYSDGYVKDRDKVFNDIIKLKPDICLVALGIPYQEEIIYKYINSFDKGIFMGVGGSFDVLSGTKKRAPKLFIKLNLEWLYRIMKEPSRLKRFYNSNVKYIFKIKREK